MAATVHAASSCRGIRLMLEGLGSKEPAVWREPGERRPHAAEPADPQS